MKEKIIRLIIKNSVDRVQQSIPNKEQMLWVEERILSPLISALKDDLGYDFEYSIMENPARDGEYIIEILQTL